MAELKRKANIHLNKLMGEREEEDERKRRLKKKLEILEQVQEDEKCTRSFFSKIKLFKQKEEISSLVDEEKKGDKVIEVEYKDTLNLKRIATNFYKDLWKKRRVSTRERDKLLEQVKRKIDAEGKKNCDKEMTVEEVRETKKKMNKHKSPGLDGIPAEFYQHFDFLDEWLVEVFKEIVNKEEMTISMRKAVVKLLFKKKDRKKMENYRPLSLLCTDYKLLAKIITERMKLVLNMVIDVDQQGFVKEGDIAGNIILVKEIIKYCNEQDEEAYLVLMDFMKAYDRVDRETMMATLETMNFGDYFLKMVRTLYNESTAAVMVNGELAEEFSTFGGVRQGCPLSPFLFIVVLELMAIAVRENKTLKGIKLPNVDEEDKISLFADDSATIVADKDQLRESRETIHRYEKASGSKLHDGKTLIMKIGKGRKKEFTNHQIGVDFKILKDGDIEKYLGDMVGNEVKEQDTFDEPMEKMEKTGKKWNQQGVGPFGRAIVANTVLLSKIKFRADVNPLSQTLRKNLKNKIREFMWNEGKPKVRWEILLLPEDQGGLGLKDPECMLDAAKITIFKNLFTKTRQPWMKWIERRLDIVKKRWGVEGNLLGHQPTKKQIKDLKEDCLTESTLRIWYELEGSTERRNQLLQKDAHLAKFREVLNNLQQGIYPDIRNLVGEAKQETDKLDREIGMEVEGSWTPIAEVPTKTMYNKLLTKRIKWGNYQPKETHKTLKRLKKFLHPKERTFWWKLSHGANTTRKTDCKWLRDSKGNLVSNKCPICKTCVEDRNHYDYECPAVKVLIKQMERRLQTSIDRETWNLNKPRTDPKVELQIAKVRYIYHNERWKVANGKRRQLNVDIIVDKLDQAMESVEGLC